MISREIVTDRIQLLEDIRDLEEPREFMIYVASNIWTDRQREYQSAPKELAGEIQKLQTLAESLLHSSCPQQKARPFAFGETVKQVRNLLGGVL